jgi:TolA-binding protein
MNNNLQIDILLDKLLNNGIARNEVTAALHKEGITDTEQEIDLHFAAAKALQRHSVFLQVQSVHQQFINNHIKENLSEVPKTQPAKVIRITALKWMMRIAATVIIFIAVWFAYQYGNTSSGRLYSEIYQPYNVNTDRGMGDIVTHNMVQEFKDKQYNAVIKTYESLSVSNNREKFMAAYAYHQTTDYNQAIILFQQILAYNIQNNTRLYNDEAEFYLGLSYLKMKHVKDATAIFQAIYSNPNHTFNERVSEWMITKLKWLY